MRADRLTALDQVMLAASEIWPQDIGALAILDGRRLLDETGRFRIEAAREAVASRLHLVPRFRQLIHHPRRGLGGPLWVDAPTFDLVQHVRELPLEPPAGEAELLEATEQIRRQALDSTRPLWEMWFLTGLPERQVGLFVRIHHTIADGMAAMTAISAFLDPVPDTAGVATPPWAPRQRPSPAELLVDNAVRHVRPLVSVTSALVRPRATARQFLAAWPGIRELLADEPAAETSLDRLVGPSRSIALVRSRLDIVRRIGRTYGATVNDVLLAATAGGLTALLLGRGEQIEGTSVRVYVPVSLRRRLHGPQQGNLVAQMAVPVPVGKIDPGQRLRQIAADTATRKARAHTPLGTLLGGRTTRRVMLKLAMRQRVNVTTASIPGPEVPLYIAGARILDVFPVLPLMANEPLGIGAVSYAGTFDIGITADRDALPDIDVLTAGVRDELRVLEAMAQVTTAGLRAPSATVVERALVEVGGGTWT